MADFVVSDKDFTFVVSSNRYRKTNRAETFKFYKQNGLGVCVSWHEDKNDDEGEEVPGLTYHHNIYKYNVPVEARIRVVLCVPPISARQQERDVATAMLLHQRLGSSCALSLLDDITKDALLCQIVDRSHKMTLEVFRSFAAEFGDEFVQYCDKKLAVELNAAEPYELPYSLQFDKILDSATCIVRDDKNKVFLRLAIKAE